MDVSNLVYSFSLFFIFSSQKENWHVFCGMLSKTKTMPSMLHTSYSFAIRQTLDPWYNMDFKYHFQLLLITFLGATYFSRSVKDTLSLIMLSAKFKKKKYILTEWKISLLFAFQLAFEVDWFLSSSIETWRTPSNKISVNVIKISYWEEERNPRNMTAEAKTSVRAAFLSHHYQEVYQINL